MLVFGWTYRALARLAGAPVRTLVPMAPDVLAGLNFEIGDWAGQDVPLDETVMRKTGSDAHVSRQYERRDGTECVSLYIAAGVRARTVASHRPEVCYMAAGWTLEKQSPVEVPCGDEGTILCTISEFRCGTLNPSRATILGYFIVDGRHYGDIGTLRSDLGARLGTVDHLAQVQITSLEGPDAGPARQTVCDFAADSGPAIARLFREMAEQRGLNRSCTVSWGR